MAGGIFNDLEFLLKGNYFSWLKQEMIPFAREGMVGNYFLNKSECVPVLSSINSSFPIR